VRAAHPAWGGRKIAAVLRRETGAAPSPSTVTAILKRHGVQLGANSAPGGFQRFEQERPNDLWQMDFKGHVPLREGGRLHPLTVLDDHSRYALVVAACGNERGETVKAHLIAAFRRYGLPGRIMTDNGSPWAPLPFIPGAEVAGTVAAVGPDVTGFEVGTPVVSVPPSGGYAQFVVAPIATTFPIPEGFSPVEVVSLMAQGLTGVLALRKSGRLAPGESVLVEAAAGASARSRCSLPSSTAPARSSQRPAHPRSARSPKRWAPMRRSTIQRRIGPRPCAI
jgi:hypothetical protein